MTSPLRRRPGRRDPAEQRPATASPFLGRLVFPTGHGPRSIIVECLRSDDGYTIHLPEFNEAGNYLADAPVSLTTVEETTGSGEVVSGRSRQLADRDVGADTAEALEHWSDGRPAHYFHITPVRAHSSTAVSHRHQRSVHEPEAAPSRQARRSAPSSDHTMSNGE